MLLLASVNVVQVLQVPGNGGRLDGLPTLCANQTPILGIVLEQTLILVIRHWVDECQVRLLL